MSGHKSGRVMKFILSMEGIMTNVYLDTNMFLTIFEIKEKKRYTTPTTSINLGYLEDFLSQNICRISSVVLFEVLGQCVRRKGKNWSSEFNDYLKFLKSEFFSKNRGDIIVNELNHMNFDISKYNTLPYNDIDKFMLEEKIKLEVYILSFIISTLCASMADTYIDVSGRKVNDEHYNDFCSENYRTQKESIEMSLRDHYDDKLSIKEFETKLNSILFCTTHKNLKYLAEDRALTHKRCNWFLKKYPEKAIELCNGLPEFFFEQANKIADEEGITNEDGEMAVFIKIENSSDYLHYIKPLKAKEDLGVEYIKNVLSKIKKNKSNVYKLLNNNIDAIFKMGIFKDFKKGGIDYIEYLLQGIIEDVRHLRKNDTGDYLIATMAYYHEPPKNSDAKLTLTIDNNVRNFLKKYGKHYDESIYSNIFKV